MKLKDWMKLERYSALQISQELSVSRQAIYRIMNQEMEPSLRLAINIKVRTRGRVKPEDLLLHQEEKILNIEQNREETENNCDEQKIMQ